MNFSKFTYFYMIISFILDLSIMANHLGTYNKENEHKISCVFVNEKNNEKNIRKKVIEWFKNNKAKIIETLIIILIANYINSKFDLWHIFRSSQSLDKEAKKQLHNRDRKNAKRALSNFTEMGIYRELYLNTVSDNNSNYYYPNLSNKEYLSLVKEAIMNYELKKYSSEDRRRRGSIIRKEIKLRIKKVMDEGLTREEWRQLRLD